MAGFRKPSGVGKVTPTEASPLASRASIPVYPLLDWRTQIEGICQHAILCGYGRIGQILAHELAGSGFPFVVVDLDDTRLALAEASGSLFVKGSATAEETLDVQPHAAAFRFRERIRTTDAPVAGGTSNFEPRTLNLEL